MNVRTLIEIEVKTNLKVKRLIYLVIVWSIFLVYLSILFKVVLFKYSHSQSFIIERIQTQLHWESIKIKIYYYSNLIPFRTIYNYVINNENWRIGYINVVGNTILFIPFGLIISAMMYKSNSNRRIFSYATLTSLSLEVIQLILGLGQFDIDDLILNSIGAIIGIMLFNFVTIIYRSIFRKWIKEDLIVR
ncbi:VanZ family protein [Cohnella herbarum]|uniref:VanZ family protein n=1 Tax=Cohnella herbarum TaxID=2728023 RepID=A0A7Z2ZKF1_9BACL|nr:VanZ family protein [Cohnella herbarum]